MCSPHLAATSTHSPAPYDLELLLHSMLPRESSAPTAPGARTIPLIDFPPVTLTCPRIAGQLTRPAPPSGGYIDQSRWGDLKDQRTGVIRRKRDAARAPVRALGEPGWTGRLISLTPTRSRVLTIRDVTGEAIVSTAAAPQLFARKIPLSRILMRTPIRAAASTQLPATNARKLLLRKGVFMTRVAGRFRESAHGTRREEARPCRTPGR